MAVETIQFFGKPSPLFEAATVPEDSVAFENDALKEILSNLECPCFAVQSGERIGLSNQIDLSAGKKNGTRNILCGVPSMPLEQLGDPDFRMLYNTRYAYYAGAMANAIASKEMVIALGKKGFMGSFGAGGLLPDQVEDAIITIKRELPDGPYLFNLLYSPSEPALEEATVELYLKHNITCVEAAAYIGLSPYIVHYRAAGLELDKKNKIRIKNKIIAKVSRREVATKFMSPAPEKLVTLLLDQRRITPMQAELLAKVPMADDITVEADSGGHTDNRPLVSLVPSILSLRDHIQAEYMYDTPIRVGAAGGIGTPSAAIAAFAMGAAYIVTGSVNQACTESGTSLHTKKVLAQADMADVTMAPSADMFEMGVNVQVLKRGTLFAMRARKLFDMYKRYHAIEEIPAKERVQLEKQIFQKSINDVWSETQAFFNDRDPQKIIAAADHPKKKMALIFRWYLGLASHWANSGTQKREMDYQIWCGPSMGAFNAWVAASYLNDVGQRKVVDVAYHILNGASYLCRIHQLKLQGVFLSPDIAAYHPEPLKE